jgi:uncharacterized protein involved in exopolysaccharide biosynthesis
MEAEGNGQNKMEAFRPGQAIVERPERYSRTYPAYAEKPPDLLAWWRIVQKRRWTVMTAFVMLFGTTLIGSLKQKSLYRAKSLIEIDRENPGVLTPQELFQLDEVSDSYLETQYKVLSSDDLAVRVIRQLGLDHVAEFRPVRHWPWSEAGAWARSSVGSGNIPSERDPLFQETVLAKFQDRLDIRPIRRS